MAFLKKIPIVATPFNLRDFSSMLDLNKRQARFEKELCQHLNSNYVYTVNSGTSAFYLILKVISSVYPEKKEVILPAYTAASLILPLKKLGLKAVLCDISLSTFNLDVNCAVDLACERTLCIVAVHLFGLVCDIDAIRQLLRERNKRVIIVEDCAQALGTLVDGRQVGSKADISLHSFNRGKNLSTCYGGAISTDSEELANLVKKELPSLKSPSILRKILITLEFALLSLAVKPFIYNGLYLLLKAFRSVKPPLDFSVLNYTDIQAAVGSSLLKRLESFSVKRNYNGSVLYKSLINKKAVRLATVLDSSRPAYNRFPVLVEDMALKEKIKNAFLKEGIDSSGMYESPLHQIFDLGFKEGDLPNAESFARMLITVPCHPLVNESVLESMKKVFEVNL